MAKAISAKSSDIKWKTIIGLLLLVIATALNWMWVYGILFIVWAINDATIGVTHFIESIHRDQNPYLFWIIIGLWVLLSGYWLFEPWLGT